jgi:hypothetical protein
MSWCDLCNGSKSIHAINGGHESTCPSLGPTAPEMAEGICDEMIENLRRNVGAEKKRKEKSGAMTRAQDATKQCGICGREHGDVIPAMEYAEKTYYPKHGDIYGMHDIYVFATENAAARCAQVEAELAHREKTIRALMEESQAARDGKLAAESEVTKLREALEQASRDLLAASEMMKGFNEFQDEVQHDADNVRRYLVKAWKAALAPSGEGDNE